MTLVVLFGVFALLIAVNLPIAVALGLSSVVYLLFSGVAPLILVAQRTIAGVDSFPLLAIPLFLLAGNLMHHGGLTERIVRLCAALVGSITGGLALVVVMACMMFGALSGSGIADILAVGTMLLPAMRDRGYPPAFSVALLATAGSISTVIPPSIVLIVYGMVTNTSIGALYAAALVPGMLCGFALMLVAYIMARKHGWRGTSRFSWAELAQALRDAALALLAPVIIVGGIRGAIFTATEAAAIGVAYALIVGGLVYRTLSWRVIAQVLAETAQASAAILIVIATAGIFGWILAAEQVPRELTAMIAGWTDNGMLVLLAMMAVLLVLGTFMETIAVILILAPIFLALLDQFGISPVQFGILLTINLAIGANTPPVAVSLMVASRIGGVAMYQTLGYLLPMLGALLAVLALLVAFPWLAGGH